VVLDEQSLEHAWSGARAAYCNQEQQRDAFAGAHPLLEELVPGA
jgi:hypothetical protein